LGFDSLWVRDHVVFEPHGMEGTDPTFIDPFVTLGYLAGVTDQIGFGTATLIPFRHPLHFAASVGSLAWVSSRALDLAVGAGGFNHEFELLGMSGVDRADLMVEHVGIAGRLWDGEVAPYDSARYEFRALRIEPRPQPRPTMWFGGCSPRAARIAAKSFDGWLPGRITFKTFRHRKNSIDQLRSEHQLPMIKLGAMPLISVAQTRERALERVNVPGLLASPNRFWATPDSGAFDSVEDLAGSLIAGGADDIIEGIERYRALGCDTLVLDLRFRFDDWEDQLDALAEILDMNPAVRAT
jgi:alkanesulfonate monooxygenase SsuD/methylene tetrahydromethanopterin reductase-like flavin-dependent oxidoreductase (luciferase family)